MRIAVKKTENGDIAIAFDDKQVTLNGAETKTLLLELTKVLIPEAAMAKSAEKRAEDLVGKIKSANDIGIQKLLRMAEHDDLLVLLKHGEADPALTSKIYGNMTEKSRKIFAEDLAYQFKEAVSDEALGKAVGRIAVTARELEDEGSLTYS